MTPCANQNTPLTSPSAASAARNIPACPSAAGASSGTNVPGTLPSPSLPDKAAGIYETLGPAELLCQLVAASERTASAASESAALFAGFVRDGYSPTLDQVYSCALQGCDQQLRQAYEITWHNLLRQARQRGLPDDSSAARVREQRFTAAGLHRPAFVEKGVHHE